MGIVAADVNFARTVEAQIRQFGERAAKHGIEAMREGGAKIVELAKDYAPHDEGKLEEAIELAPETRDEQGRKTVNVWVNPTKPGSGGMAVGDYAYLMHEGLGPYGDGYYNLGKESVKKDGGRGVVGGKFLERAIREVLPRLIDKINGLRNRQGLK